MFEEMSDFEIEVEVTKILFPFVLEDGYEFCGTRDGFIYTKEDRKEQKLKGERLICTIRPYCRSPEYAWSIIVDNKINIEFQDGGFVNAWNDSDSGLVESQLQDRPLRAAMICFLKVKSVL